MLNYTNLLFLQSKIQNLGTALFFSEQVSLLKMPTSVVNVLKVDDLGQAWFLVPRPGQALHEFDRDFPTRLEFFRKGSPYYLHVMGKAFIVNDPEEINGLIADGILQQPADNKVLIKVKMLKAEYFESLPDIRLHWWQELKVQVTSWLFNTRPGYRPYQVDPQLVFSS
ncbi:MAG: hypothetical protein P4L51_03245 [Puia sp.]|nr:hypothetical protein [Puia sp.]